MILVCVASRLLTTPQSTRALFGQAPIIQLRYVRMSGRPYTQVGTQTSVLSCMFNVVHYQHVLNTARPQHGTPSTRPALNTARPQYSRPSTQQTLNTVHSTWHTSTQLTFMQHTQLHALNTTHTESVLTRRT